jgi:integrase
MQPNGNPRRVRVKRHPGVYYREGSAGRHYEITYYDSAGRRRWERVPGDLDDAVARRAQIVRDKHRGERVGRTLLTLREHAPIWLEQQHQLRPKTRSEYERHLTQHVLPVLGRYRLTDINEDHIAQLIAHMQKQGYAAWSIRATLTPLSRLLGHAARRGLIPQNPVRRLEVGERPRVQRRDKRILTTDEMRRLLDEARRYRPLIATALFAGLRLGELLGLVWADIDLTHRAIHVRKQLDLNGDRVAPKTPQAERTVVIPRSLVAALKAHHAEAAFTDPCDFVFASTRGTGLSHRNVQRRALEEPAKRAGITGEPRLRFHDLRHTYASVLIAQGANVVFVSQQLGHANPAITLSVYAHEFARAEHADRVVGAVETALKGVLSPRGSKNGSKRPSRRSPGTPP